MTDKPRIISTVTLIDLTTLSDDGLRNLREYWHRRLYSRGGGWFSAHAITLATAAEQLKEIDEELKSRGLAALS